MISRVFLPGLFKIFWPAVFQYTYSVIAIAGIGLIQNANHAFEWIMGSETMMEYYQRMLLSESETKKEDLDVPVLTIISLGGNDYNHQNGNVPSQEETSQGFARFISEKIGLNDENPKLGTTVGQKNLKNPGQKNS